MVFSTADNELKEGLAFIEGQPCKPRASSLQSSPLSLLRKNQDYHRRESNRTLLTEADLTELEVDPPGSLDTWETYLCATVIKVDKEYLAHCLGYLLKL